MKKNKRGRQLDPKTLKKLQKLHDDAVQESIAQLASLKNSLVLPSDNLIRCAKEASKQLEGTAKLISFSDNELQERIKILEKNALEGFAKLPDLTSVLVGMDDTMQGVAYIQQELTEAMQGVASIQQDAMKAFQGIIINVENTKFFEPVDISAALSVKIDTFETDRRHENEYMLSSTVTQERGYESVGLTVISKMEMRLSSVENQMIETNRTVKYLREESQRKDKIIQKQEALIQEKNEIIASLKGKTLFKVEDVQYTRNTAEIKIGNKTVEIKPNGKQSMLCEVLLKNQASIKRKWTIEQIIYELDGNLYNRELFEKPIIYASYNLNKKIKAETGIDGFLKTGTKKIYVNPKYIT